MRKFSGDDWIVPETLVQGLDIGPYELTPNKEISAGLTSKIQGPLGKLFWLEDEVPFDQPIPSAGIVHEVESEFMHVREWAKGRKDSVQGVFFGKLAVGSEAEIPVAVKPYLTALGAGMHETALLLHLEAQGFPVYRVLGASWTEEQGFSMITAFEPDSKSLDNIDWSKGLEQPLSEHLTNLDAIKQVGVTLGLLHANGVLHRDTQIKNFAVAGDDVRVIDLAQARVVVR